MNKTKKKIKSQRGMAMLWVVLLMALVPSIAYLYMQTTDLSFRIMSAPNRAQTKQRLQTLSAAVARTALDVDSDGQYEPLAAGTDNTFPATLAGTTTDEWRKQIIYCDYDLGSENGADILYSNNNVAPPVANTIAALISAGPDGVFQSDCEDGAAQGDDLLTLVLHSDATAAAGQSAGWVDDGATVRLATTADAVSVGAGESTTEKLEINGALKVGAASGAQAGTIQWNGTHFQGYTGSEWKNLDETGGSPASSSYGTLVASHTFDGTTTGVTLSGLDLSTAGKYRLIFDGKMTAATGGNLLLDINGASTGHYGRAANGTNVSGTAGITNSYGYLTQSNGYYLVNAIRADLMIHKALSGSDYPAFFGRTQGWGYNGSISQYHFMNYKNMVAYASAGANVTSLYLHTTTASNNIAAGSTVKLYSVP